MDILLQDIRYAARKLLRSPGFTLVVVATLALAIGATTAVFSIVNGVLLKPLPIRTQDDVVAIGTLRTESNSVAAMSAVDFVDYGRLTHGFASTAAIDTRNMNLTKSGGNPVRLAAHAVSASYFNVLGLSMTRGRGFMPGDDGKGAQRVVVLSDKLWRTQFNADSSIVGSPITLDGNSYSVIGIAPNAVAYPSAADLWVPLVYEDWMLQPDNRGAHFLNGIARLRTGTNLDAAKREFTAVGEALRAQYPQTNTNMRTKLERLDDVVVGNARTTLFTMLGAVGFVLLIACANIANLLLIRASTRETEMALRTALGAGRGRILRQLITESVLLSIAGAAVGGAIAAWIVDFVAALAPRGLPRVAEISIDARVLAFTIGLGAITGLIFGLVPALHAARPELAQMLRDSGRSSSARRSSSRMRSGLVVSEVALAVVLLVGAGLLIRSYLKLIEVDPGFRPEHVVSFSVSLPSVKYPYDRELNRYAEEVLGAMNTMPGTQASGVGLSRPMQAVGMRTSFDVVGEPPAAPTAVKLTAVRPVSADYFSALGIPLRAGRMFTTAEDRYGPPPVVVVSEAFAKKYFPAGDAIGKHITLGIDHDTAAAGKSVTAGGEIVGVVADVKQRELKETPDPAVYLPHGTYPESNMAFVIRSNAELSVLTSAIRQRLQQIDPDIPLYGVETMSDAIAGSVAQPRFYTSLLGAFALLALLLAALGIYGVISYGVNQRIRELGIRIALGATNDRIRGLVLKQGLGLVLSGAAIGTAGAFALTRFLSSMLFGVQATDAATLMIVPATLALVGLVASYLPARRASRVDPVIAMRAE